jgi:hypothetical protein
LILISFHELYVLYVRNCSRAREHVMWVINDIEEENRMKEAK